jgi:LysM repeat protein
LLFAASVLLGGTAGWWLFLRDGPADVASDPRLAAIQPPADPSLDRSPGSGASAPAPDGREGRAKDAAEGAAGLSPSSPAQLTTNTGENAAALLNGGLAALSAGDLLLARRTLNRALRLDPAPGDAVRLYEALGTCADSTLLADRVIDGDPLAERYVVQGGDTLGKIARTYGISDDLIARLNGIRNKNHIREGQTLKVLRGPFRVEVDTEAYALEVFLGEGEERSFVRRYAVGLGQDGSTPRGTWVVKTKLVNPTYYPPRGGRIIDADDPENPLGERWIGLEGVGGEAVGQQRYGIHGTIEPESIGRNASLGCIRMYNNDVEHLYEFVIEQHSTVLVR